MSKFLRLWVVAGVALAGCSGLPTNLKTPEIAFVSLRPVEVSVFEQKLEVRLKVQNPNSIELPVNGLDVEMELAGEPFAKGVSSREFVVPANGEAEFDMNVTANAMNALLKVAADGSGAVDYRLQGKLATKIGLLRTIPFEDSGQVSVADLLGKKRKGN